MSSITTAERRALRAKAHALSPVVSIGQQGLTPAVLHEIDVNLLAHELIKIRVFADQRADREALLQRICDELDAAPVQHIGKLLIVWRKAVRAEDPPETKPKRSARPGPGAKGTSAPRNAARKSPQARHPRTPVTRSPARPAPSAGGRGRGQAPAQGTQLGDRTVARREPSAGARRRRRGFSGS